MEEPKMTMHEKLADAYLKMTLGVGSKGYRIGFYSDVGNDDIRRNFEFPDGIFVQHSVRGNFYSWDYFSK